MSLEGNFVKPVWSFVNALSKFKRTRATRPETWKTRSSSLVRDTPISSFCAKKVPLRWARTESFMYLSPLAKEKQRLSSPTNTNKESHAMSANQRIGHPSSGLRNQNAHLKKPGLFEVPKSEHLNVASGFVNCLITRVGSKNLYHFSHQVGGSETVSMIGNKLSKS
jgi:hypothetical protein